MNQKTEAARLPDAAIVASWRRHEEAEPEWAQGRSDVWPSCSRSIKSCPSCARASARRGRLFGSTRLTTLEFLCAAQSSLIGVRERTTFELCTAAIVLRQNFRGEGLAR